MNATNCESLQINELEDITKSANVPTLLMVIYQVTGDERWLAPPYQPTRTKGLSDHDSGGLPDTIQAEIRHAAAQAFHHLQEGRPPAIAEAQSTRRRKGLASSNSPVARSKT